MKILRNILIGAVAAFVIYFAPSFDHQKVEASTDIIAANELTSIAEKYKGIRYRYGGTTTAGFDCSGYVQFVYKQVGVSLSRSTSGMYSTGTKIAKSNLQVGDLVFFKTTSAQVGHVGIYVGNNNFIHSSTSRGVMVSSINDPYYWGKRYVGAKRVASVATSVAVK
jgi:cell wall-associated NlpC family hydrolase